MSNPQMTAEEFFNPLIVPDGQLLNPGRETGWMYFLTISFQGPQLLIMDASLIPHQEHALMVDLSPSDYRVSVKGVDYGIERRLSRVSCCRARREIKLGAKLGETWTDSAQTGMYDLGRLMKCCSGQSDRVEEIIQRKVPDIGMLGIVSLDHASCLVFNSGFGDGSYPVYELISERQRVGVEIEFISPEAEYPMDWLEQTTTSLGSKQDSPPVTDIS
jgi:hypothetical protein